MHEPVDSVLVCAFAVEVVVEALVLGLGGGGGIAYSSS